MKMTLRLVCFVVCAAMLVGCASWQREMKRNNQNLLLLEPGMSRQQVQEIMGPPNMNEAYANLRGTPTVIWFYYTERKWADGSYTKDEMTPLVFHDGKLAGWGSEFYESVRTYEIRSR